MAAKIIDRIETFRGLDKSHYFRLVAANNEIVSISEAYTKPSSRNETAEQLATQLRVAIVSGSTRFKPAKPALPTPASKGNTMPPKTNDPKKKTDPKKSAPAKAPAKTPAKKK